MDDELLLSASTPEAKIEYLKMKDDYNSYLPQEISLANLSPIDEEIRLSTTEAFAMANKEMLLANLSPSDEEISLSTTESVAMANKVQACYGEALELCQAESSVTITLPRHGESLQIFVRTLIGSSRVFVVKTSDSINSVKERIHKKEFIPPEVQVLVHEFKQLDDLMTIGDYPNIMEGSTLILVARLRGSMDWFRELDCFGSNRKKIREDDKEEKKEGEVQLTDHHREEEGNVNPPQTEEDREELTDENVNPQNEEDSIEEDNEDKKDGEELTDGRGENVTPQNEEDNKEEKKEGEESTDGSWEIDENLKAANEAAQKQRAALEKSLALTVESYKKRERWIPYDKIESITDFSSDMEIGRGACGKVYKGVFRDKPVAVKRIENTCVYLEYIEQFLLTELEIYLECEHDNIVKMVGFCIVGNCERLYIVTELMEKGDLKNLIHGKDEGQKQGQGWLPLTWSQRIHILAGIARVLDFLHNHTKKRPVFYIDLKPSNVLVDSTYSAKVCDFGISKFWPNDGTDKVFSLNYSIGYACPEYRATHTFKRASETYQLGVVIFETISGRKARNYLRGHQGLPNFVEELIKEGKIKDLVDPKINGGLNDEEFKQFQRVVELARQCCSAELDSRPTDEYALNVLEDLDRKLNPHEAGPSS